MDVSLGAQPLVQASLRFVCLPLPLCSYYFFGDCKTINKFRVDAQSLEVNFRTGFAVVSYLPLALMTCLFLS